MNFYDCFKNKKIIIELYILIILVLIFVPVMIYDYFCIDWNNGNEIKKIEVSDIMVYMCSAMTLLGTSTLGIVNLYQGFLDREREKNRLRPLFDICEESIDDKRIKIVVNSLNDKAFFYNLYIDYCFCKDGTEYEKGFMVSEEKLKNIIIVIPWEENEHQLFVDFNYTDFWGYNLVDSYCLYRNREIKKIEFLKREESYYFHNTFEHIK